MRVVILLLVVFAALGAVVVQAQEATPTPRLPGPNDAAIVVFVINDLNANGRQDPGEPGLEAWQVWQACSDAIRTLGQTDVRGELLAAVSPTEPCISIRGQHGWLTHGLNHRNLDLTIGTTAGLVFLVRYIGDGLENFGGDLLVNGSPARPGTSVDASFNGHDCGETEMAFRKGATRYSMYILGSTDRAGCPSAGQQFSITVNGVVVAMAVSAPGAMHSLHLSVEATAGLPETGQPATTARGDYSFPLGIAAAGFVLLSSGLVLWRRRTA